jgi:hypothetical protein
VTERRERALDAALLQRTAFGSPVFMNRIVDGFGERGVGELPLDEQGRAGELGDLAFKRAPGIEVRCDGVDQRRRLLEDCLRPRRYEQSTLAFPQ